LENTNIMNESYVISDNDIQLNLNNWKPEKNKNILYITGLSGSGKSTLAEKMESEHNAEMFELDGFENNYDSSKSKLIEKFKIAYPKYAKDLDDKWKTVLSKHSGFSEEFYDAFILFLNFIKKEMYDNPKKLYIIEGVQIYQMIPIQSLKSRPLIIKGTSAFKSFIGQMKREGMTAAVLYGYIIKHQMKVLWNLTKSDKHLSDFKTRALTENATKKEVIMDLSYKEKQELSPSMYGLPQYKKFPMPDEQHLISAIAYFKTVKLEKDRETLAKNILLRRAALNSNVTIKRSNPLAKYVPATMVKKGLNECIVESYEQLFTDDKQPFTFYPCNYDYTTWSKDSNGGLNTGILGESISDIEYDPSKNKIYKHSIYDESHIKFSNKLSTWFKTLTESADNNEMENSMMSEEWKYRVERYHNDYLAETNDNKKLILSQKLYDIMWESCISPVNEKIKFINSVELYKTAHVIKESVGELYPDNVYLIPSMQMFPAINGKDMEDILEGFPDNVLDGFESEFLENTHRRYAELGSPFKIPDTHQFYKYATDEMKSSINILTETLSMEMITDRPRPISFTGSSDNVSYITKHKLSDGIVSFMDKITKDINSDTNVDENLCILYYIALLAEADAMCNFKQCNYFMNIRARALLAFTDNLDKTDRDFAELFKSSPIYYFACKDTTCLNYIVDIINRIL
jgi:hypothetical protein